MTAHVDAPQPFELALVPGDRLGEGAVDIQSNDPHAYSSVSVRSKRELAGDTTSTDPRSRRIQESRKGRPGNELGLLAVGPTTFEKLTLPPRQSAVRASRAARQDGVHDMPG
jgi:hypothetical protein